MITLARLLIGDILVARDKIGLDPLIVIRHSETEVSAKTILAQCLSASKILTNSKMTTSTCEANAALSAMISEEQVLVEIWGLTTQIGPNDVVLNWKGLHDILMAAPCFMGSGKSVKQVLETIFPEIKTTLPKLHNFLQDESKSKIHEEFCENDNIALISGTVKSRYPNAANGYKFLKITKRCQKYFTASY